MKNFYNRNLQEVFALLKSLIILASRLSNSIPSKFHSPLKKAVGCKSILKLNSTV